MADTLQTNFFKFLIQAADSIDQIQYIRTTMRTVLVFAGLL